MVTATASMTPTKVFLNRWVKQLIPELVKMGAVTESGVPLISHWMASTIAELESELYGGSVHPETVQRTRPPIEQQKPAQVESGPWSPERTLKELTENLQVTRVVFGAIPSQRGHRVQGLLGAGNKWAVTYAEKEIHHRALFIKEWDGYFNASFEHEPFLVKLMPPAEVGDIMVMKCAFNDPTGDGRDGSHTDFTIGFPVDLAEKIIPAVLAHPEILIILFQQSFPEMDRTRGNLRLHPEWRKSMERVEEYNARAIWAAISKLNWH